MQDNLKNEEEFSTSVEAPDLSGAQDSNQNEGQVISRMRTDRTILKYIILTLITCGIYNFYFYYCLAKDINVICKDDGEMTPGLGKQILFSIITCGIYSYFWEFNFAERMANYAPRFGLNFKDGGSTVLLWKIFGTLLCGIGPFIALHIEIRNINELAKAYNAKYFPDSQTIDA